MSLWFLLWFLLSAILIGASVWSTVILMQQKKAWAAYAKKKGLQFNRGTFLGPASLEGEVDGYLISFFTAERQEADARKRRLMTVLEVQCPFGLVTGAVAGTPEMLPFMQSLTLLKSFKVEHEKWNPAHRMFARNEELVSAYLTPARIETIASILSMKNADILVLFDDKQALIRIETSDPLRDAEKIEKIISRLMESARTLEIDKQERESLNKKSVKEASPDSKSD